MAKVIRERVGAFYQSYPTLAAIVTVNANGIENAMTVDWHTPLSFEPPLYGIAIVPGRFTYRLIVESKEFGINFLPFEAAGLMAQVGSTGGQYINKFQRFNIAKEEPLKTRAPILEAAYAAYECRLVDEKDCGDHRLLIGEIVAVHVLLEAFTPGEMLALDKVSPTLYLGEEFYLTTAKNTVTELDFKV